MSKVKLRNNIDVCADCGASDSAWASVNRGVLVCDECCSIHRSLGRHISQIKSLKKGAWTASQLAMVHTLYNSGANSVWEHTLLDPMQSKSGRKKPTHKDPLHPTKADFIRAKYQNLSFVHRPNKEDAEQTEDDISQQLYSSVRTSNVETSLRLLSFGADPNYIHPEKGNTPLHVASMFGQSSQAELLVVYGADPAAPDTEGRTPVDIARKSGHEDLVCRLMDCQYEVTDRLAFYLCGRKPDHASGQHFIIPEMADSLDLSELAKVAKRKLKALPNNLFEELVMDVYDEVDRRENDAIWLATQNHSALVTDRQTIPFLPVNPEFSSTRNQGRQKLARFTAREFATLIIDILNEAKVRQTGQPIGGSPAKALNGRLGTERSGNLSDDEPVYDSVASDDENTDSSGVHVGIGNRPRFHGRPSSDQEGRPITLQEYMEVKKQLASSEVRISHLLKSNKDMRHEINILQTMVQKLIQENSQLRTFMGCCQESSLSVSNAPPAHPPPTSPSHLHHHHNHSHHPRSMPECHRVLPNGFEGSTSAPTGQHTLLSCSGSHSDSLIVGSSSGGVGSTSHGGSRGSPRPGQQQQQRPASMYEPRQFSNQGWLPAGGSSFTQNSNCCSSHASGYSLPRDDSGIGHTHSSHSSRNSGDYDNTSGQVSHTSSCPHSRSNSLSPPTELAPLLLSSGRPPLTVGGEGLTLPIGRGTGDGLPTREEVMRKTEQITKKIQELLLSAQEGKHECFLPCSEKIYRAVVEMASIFPQSPYEEAIHAALKQLTSCALRLQLECRSLLSQQQPQPQQGPIDHRFITQQVIQCAYDIAKAAKQVVTYSE